jgi:hypothetical protein
VRVVVDLNAGIGQGCDSSGDLLWVDIYTNIQQVKASAANRDVLTGSNAFYCELKGAGGSTTLYGGAAGDRIIWSSADASGVANAGKASMSPMPVPVPAPASSTGATSRRAKAPRISARRSTISASRRTI